MLIALQLYYTYTLHFLTTQKAHATCSMRTSYFNLTFVLFVKQRAYRFVIVDTLNRIPH